jgi:uncharacterized membrane protein
MEVAMRNARVSVPMLLHPGFIAAGAILLMAALVTDFAYRATLLIQWENFSVWLITAGLVLAALAGLALLIDYGFGRLGAISWWRFALFAAAALLSLLNVFVHSRDGYTAVLPLGLGLSAVVTVLLLLAVRSGWSLRVLSPSTPSQLAEFRP